MTEIVVISEVIDSKYFGKEKTLFYCTNAAVVKYKIFYLFCISSLLSLYLKITILQNNNYII